MSGAPVLLREPPRSICLVRLSAIGDVVHTLPLAGALRRNWPDARITWVTQPLPGRVLEGSPAVDDVLTFERRSGMAAVRAYRELSRKIAGRRFDLVVVPQVALKAGILARLLPAPVRLGYDRPRASDLQWLFTNRRIPTGPRRHVVDEALEFASALGADPEPVEWNLRLSSEERAERDRYFGTFERPVCGVVVAASDPRKNWPSERWALVVDALEERWGLRVVFLGGPSAAEREIVSAIRRRCRTEPIDELADDLRRLMWLLDGCDLVLGPDTGPLHLAVGLGTPVVGLYGRTNPNVTGPWGPSRELVADGYARTADEDYGTTRAYRNDGMRRVTPRMVLDRVARAMERFVEAEEPGPEDPTPGALRPPTPGGES